MDTRWHGTIGGSVAKGYGEVRSAFEANFASGLELGAAFAVYRDGKSVVDLWGGFADEARRSAARQDTLYGVWSTSKGLAAICIALLVDRGKLGYDQVVSDIWPEFAAHGKDRITVSELLSHQAGLVATREAVSIDEYYRHERVAELLAGQEPFFAPGVWGYHTLSFGLLADELVRRVDGRPLGQFFAEEIASPYAIDAFLGLPRSEDHRHAESVGAADPKTIYFDSPDPAATAAAMANPILDWNWPNERAWRAAGIPAAGASASASGLAKLYSILVAKGTAPLLRPETRDEAIRERIAGIDRCSGGIGRYAAGFRLNTGTMGSNPASFGHAGMGGSIAFADPDRGIGVSYTPNLLLNPNWQQTDRRLVALLEAVYAAEAALAVT